MATAFFTSQWANSAEVPDAPAFEVTSIKPSQPDQEGPLIGISAGRITLTGFTLKLLMVYANWIHPDQVVGASGWMDSDRFDIVGKPESGFVSQDQLRRMLQTLLGDRFRLKFHHDQKELPVYALTVAKGGSKMKVRMPGDGGPGFRLVFQGNSLPGRNATVAQLIFVLGTRVLDRPVIDQTALMGNFDFDLSWSPDGVGAGGAAGPADSESPDILTAMQKQLGLKLDARRGPVDVLVVDKAEKPEAN